MAGAGICKRRGLWFSKYLINTAFAKHLLAPATQRIAVKHQLEVLMPVMLWSAIS